MQKQNWQNWSGPQSILGLLDKLCVKVGLSDQCPQSNTEPLGVEVDCTVTIRAVTRLDRSFFNVKTVSQLGWLKVKFLIVVNMEFKYYHNFFRKKSKILRFDVFLTWIKFYQLSKF
jgi:hypothetical protein